MTRTKIAFLYSEVAGYFMACVKSLAKEADVLVVRWPTNSEAPFQFEEIPNCTVLCKSDFSKEELQKKVVDFQADIVVCSGWMDKDYLKIVKTLNPNIKRVISLDNHWNGSVKQRVASLVSPFYLKRIFTHAWVPGTKQEKFAIKLGFKGNILKGFYCADTALFNAKYAATFDSKRANFPKRFLYVARYVEHKGIFEMWKAFKELQEELPNEWEMWCLGTGSEWENRVKHEKIRHIGFVQPSDMDQYIKETGVYILPSKFEPWGVTTQEFAVCGFPLLLSNEIGSAEMFLSDNGIGFKAGDVDEIKSAMRKVMSLGEEELIQMGERSHRIGMQYTTEDWAKTIINLKNK